MLTGLLSLPKSTGFSYHLFGEPRTEQCALRACVTASCLNLNLEPAFSKQDIFRTSLDVIFAQGGCGCPIHADIQGQAGCGSGQPGLLVGDHHIAGGWNWMSIVVLCNPGHSVILFNCTDLLLSQIALMGFSNVTIDAMALF